MAKIAVAPEQPGRITGHELARGNGWRVEDVVCTSGPADRPFEEQHSWVSIALVVAGTFQYRSPAGRDLMTPGCVLLGSASQYFECDHEHGTGDRCIAFRYTPEYFERVAADAGAARGRGFRLGRLPPLRELAPHVAQACAGLGGSDEISWEEIGVRLAACVARLAHGALPCRNEPTPARDALARATRAVRTIDRDPGARVTLGALAHDAGLSPYHFLRTFQRATGVTPHQYVVRARLRKAALRLAAEPAKVIDIAFDSGFGDVSNFNRSFRAEFGVSPRAYRRALDVAGARC